MENYEGGDYSDEGTSVSYTEILRLKSQIVKTVRLKSKLLDLSTYDYAMNTPNMTQGKFGNWIDEMTIGKFDEVWTAYEVLSVKSRLTKTIRLVSKVG